MKSLEQLDVCREATWPYGDETNDYWQMRVDLLPGSLVPDPAHPGELTPDTSIETFEEASRHKILQYCRLDDKFDEAKAKTIKTTEEMDTQGNDTLDQLRTCLSDGHPVVFCFKFYSDSAHAFNTSTSDGTRVLSSLPKAFRHQDPPLNYAKDPQNPKNFGAHAVMAICYDNANERVLIQNSWGEKWSNGGVFWMGYEYIMDWRGSYDFWMLNFLQKKYDLNNV
jgi:hypothetical protein